jgi:hypothetical protein
LETYNNILFNPLSIRKGELTEFISRRKHEEKTFQSLLRRITENKDEKEYKLFAIDMKWFNKWKTFITNDMDENILSNKEKYISDNKLIGILPPYEIDNSKICIKYNVNKYKLKSGLINKKDYCAISQFLWEWLKMNYNGGPEIVLSLPDGNSNSNSSSSKKSSVNTDTIIDNNGTVFLFDSKEISNKDFKLNESQLNSNDSDNIRDSQVNTVGDYKFNTKFNVFTINNKTDKNKFTKTIRKANK